MPRHVYLFLVKGLTFHYETVIHQNIHTQFLFEFQAFVPDRNWELKLYVMSAQSEFLSQAFLIDGFHQSNAKMLLHLH